MRPKLQSLQFVAVEILLHYGAFSVILNLDTHCNCGGDAVAVTATTAV